MNRLLGNNSQSKSAAKSLAKSAPKSKKSASSSPAPSPPAPPPLLLPTFTRAVLDLLSAQQTPGVDGVIDWDARMSRTSSGRSKKSVGRWSQKQRPAKVRPEPISLPIPPLSPGPSPPQQQPVSPRPEKGHRRRLSALSGLRISLSKTSLSSTNGAAESVPCSPATLTSSVFDPFAASAPSTPATATFSSNNSSSSSSSGGAMPTLRRKASSIFRRNSRKNGDQSADAITGDSDNTAQPSSARSSCDSCRLSISEPPVISRGQHDLMSVLNARQQFTLRRTSTTTTSASVKTMSLPSTPTTPYLPGPLIVDTPTKPTVQRAATVTAATPVKRWFTRTRNSSDINTNNLEKLQSKLIIQQEKQQKLQNALNELQQQLRSEREATRQRIQRYMDDPPPLPVLPSPTHKDFMHPQVRRPSNVSARSLRSIDSSFSADTLVSERGTTSVTESRTDKLVAAQPEPTSKRDISQPAGSLVKQLPACRSFAARRPPQRQVQVQVPTSSIDSTSSHLRRLSPRIAGIAMRDAADAASQNTSSSSIGSNASFNSCYSHTSRAGSSNSSGGCKLDGTTPVPTPRTTDPSAMTSKAGTAHGWAGLAGTLGVAVHDRKVKSPTLLHKSVALPTRSPLYMARSTLATPTKPLFDIPLPDTAAWPRVYRPAKAEEPLPATRPLPCTDSLWHSAILPVSHRFSLSGTPSTTTEDGQTGEGESKLATTAISTESKLASVGTAPWLLLPTTTASY